MAGVEGHRRRAVRAVRFGGADALAIADEALPRPHGGEVRVRVGHASIGVTDLMALRGGYALQPFPGFTPGYDLIGVLETETALSVALGLRVGTRVAALLPRMGAQTTRLIVAPTLLVAVPDGLDSATAATLPLDAVTAAVALQAAGGARRILVQGSNGAVGAIAVQLALRDGRTVVGTASSSGRHGIPVVDYRDGEWPALAIERAGGYLGAAIDHTGSPRVREALGEDGVLVHIAFAGRPGRERADTVRGGATATARRFARPRERVVTAPMWVGAHRAEYRRMLAGLLADAAESRLEAPQPEVFGFEEVWTAYRAAQRQRPGVKTVLELPAQ